MNYVLTSSKYYRNCKYTIKIHVSVRYIKLQLTVYVYVYSQDICEIVYDFTVCSMERVFLFF